MRPLASAFALFGLLACDPAPPVPPAASPSASVAAPSPSGAPMSSSTTLADAPDPPPPPAPDPPIELARGGAEAVKGSHGIVVTVEPHATKAGVAVLEAGGNAVDAAVAAAYALAVTHPSAGNIGGGGFMIVRLASGESFALDFREAGPAAVTTAKVLAEVEAGGVGWPSTAVPGTVAGLNLAREKWGTKPLAELVAPAIKLAKKGHDLSPRAGLALSLQWNKLKGDEAARKIFGKGKAPLEPGDRLVQRDLAKTLEAIATRGDAGFYDGPVADAIDRAMKKNGGDVTKADLEAYRPKLREPLRFSYRGFDVETMPPPSMGGIAVAQTLLLLERLSAHEHAADSAQGIHLFVEAAKRAYADRRTVGADPDFWGDKVPAGAVGELLRGRHLLKKPIAPDKATPPEELFLPPEPATIAKESTETTHLSVVDAQGNAVSCTVTLSASFGAKVVVPGTGVLLSNALGAFSPDGPNVAAPGKHMASSMAPTIVSRGGKTRIVIGSPGGDTIPNVVTQALRNLIDYRMTVDAAVKHARVHHQLEPNALRIEKGNEPPAAVLEKLAAMGHPLAPSPTPLGDVKAIVVDPEEGDAYAFADRREGGLALAAKKK